MDPICLQNTVEPSARNICLLVGSIFKQLALYGVMWAEAPLSIIHSCCKSEAGNLFLYVSSSEMVNAERCGDMGLNPGSKTKDLLILDFGRFRVSCGGLQVAVEDGGV